MPVYVPGVNDPGWLISAYSLLPIIRTFKGNRKKFELLGVRVIEGSSYRESTVLKRGIKYYLAKAKEAH